MGRNRRNKIINDVELSAIALEGKAIGRHEGKVILVEGGIVGEIVDVQLTKNKKDYAEGKVKTIKKASDKRKEGFCSHFNYCGGCKWQHLDYDVQAQFKAEAVADVLKRIGKIDPLPEEPIVKADKTTFYRNKLEYTFSNKSWLTPEEIEQAEAFPHRNALGFHVPRAFDKVLDIEKCYLQDDLSNQIRNGVRNYALENNLSFFDIRQQEGLLRNLIIRNSTLGDWMVIVCFYYDDVAQREGLLNYLKAEFPAITSLQYVINGKGNDTIFDQNVIVFNGTSFIQEQLGEYTFKIGPKSFFQTNSSQAKALYDVTLDFAGLTGTENVYDLYCGTGTIGLYVSGFCQKVVGIEQIPEAIEDAAFNTKLNKVTNATFLAADVKNLLDDAFITEHGTPDVVITDPPRAGMHPDVVKTLLGCQAEKIVYVSCNPATQARDIQLLSTRYEVARSRAVDMFPHTYHVENVVLLKLKS